VNQTFDAVVFEVPKPFLAALGQWASAPGAPGGGVLVVCANKAGQTIQKMMQTIAKRTIICFEKRYPQISQTSQIPAEPALSNVAKPLAKVVFQILL
jgi:hypothetical protein